MYEPRTPVTSDTQSPQSIMAWLWKELQHLAGELRKSVPHLFVDELHNAPLRPRSGMIVLADGTDWNPGAGAGYYGYYGGAWHKLG